MAAAAGSVGQNLRRVRATPRAAAVKSVSAVARPRAGTRSARIMSVRGFCCTSRTNSGSAVRIFACYRGTAGCIISTARYTFCTVRTRKSAVTDKRTIGPIAPRRAGIAYFITKSFINRLCRIQTTSRGIAFCICSYISVSAHAGPFTAADAVSSGTCPNRIGYITVLTVRAGIMACRVSRISVYTVAQSVTTVYPADSLITISAVAAERATRCAAAAAANI